MAFYMQPCMAFYMQPKGWFFLGGHHFPNPCAADLQVETAHVVVRLWPWPYCHKLSLHLFSILLRACTLLYTEYTLMYNILLERMLVHGPS